MQAIVRLSSAIMAISFFTLPVAVCAHHSMTEFDRDVVAEVEGELVGVSWQNPHILLDIAGTDDAGREVVWHLEGGAVSTQRRRGLTSARVQVGDHVRAAGWPSTRRPGYIQVNHVLPPDGTELLVGGVREPRWSEDHAGGGAWAVDPAKAAVAEGSGLFRVWSQRFGGAWFFRGPDAYSLTDSALAALAEWDEFGDNPLLDCAAPGMPALMSNPYPMEFVETDGDIVVRFEEFDAVRTIHLTSSVDPAGVPASHLGYSVGHWEGETLVVSTSRINWPYFNRVGIPQSEAVQVLERFTPLEDEDRLDYQLTVTDPATLIEPFVWEGYWTWRPGEEVHPYECTLED